MEDTEENEKYIRVGTNYYKIVQIPDLNGNKNETMLSWNKETINNDHGKEFLSKIPKYDGFTCIPSHLNYQKTIGKFYNLYHPLPIQVFSGSVDEIDFSEKIINTIYFLRHIFGEQIELGLDYLKIILEKPSQILPILCLVSKEKSTGKTSFLKWLKIIFGSNMTYSNASSFLSQFNSDTAGKIIVASEEVLFDRMEQTEKLKFLSTTDRDKLEHKGKDRQEIFSFSKYILCSNNETSFVITDDKEIRFWVRKINTIQHEDVHLLKKLENEVPYFLRFLITRPYHTECKTRMWFTPGQIRTKALDKLLQRNNNKLEAKLIETLHELFDEVEIDEINGTPQDFLNLINRLFRGLYYSRNDVRKILKNLWNLEPQKNTLAYIRYDVEYNGRFCENNAVGRYFTIKKEFVNQKFDEFDED